MEESKGKGMPRRYECRVQLAKRRRKREKITGEMLMGIRKELIEKGIAIEGKEEGIMVGRTKREKEKWRIVGVYVSGNLEKTENGTVDRGERIRN